MNLFKPSLKIFLIIFSLLVWLSGCGQRLQNVNLGGTIDECTECEIIVGEPSDKGVVIIDTVYTNNEGEFEFKTNTFSPKFLTLQINKSKEPIILLVTPNEDLSLKINHTNKNISYTVAGSIGSILVRDLNSKLKKVVEEIDTLSNQFKRYRNLEKFDSIKTVIDERYNFVISQHREYTVSFIKANPFSLASILALNQQYNQNQFVLNKREDFALYQLIDSSLNTLYPTNPLVKAFSTKVSNMAKQLSLYDRQQDMFAIGEYLPLPNLTLINGDEVTFRQVMGKYTLVDFWGTWCSDCMANNYKLKDIFELNSPKGFKVIQFVVDDNIERVNSAIASDSITWTVVADFKQWESPFLDEFKINSIPSNYLIDRYGVIIEKNLTPNKLNELLTKLLIAKLAPVKNPKPAVDSVKVDSIR